MGIPINDPNGNKVYFMTPAGSPQAAMVAQSIAGYQARENAIRDQVQATVAGLGLPPIYGYLVTHKGAKVDNLELVYRQGKVTNEVKQTINGVQGKHGVKFRKKTEHYDKMRALMEGCPPMASYQDFLLGAIQGKEVASAFGGPNTLDLPDGRYALALGTRMDLNDWEEKLTAAGFQPISRADYLRLEAEFEEAQEASKKKSA